MCDHDLLLDLGTYMQLLNPFMYIPFAGSSHVHAYKLSNERTWNVERTYVTSLGIPAVQVLYTIS